LQGALIETLTTMSNLALVLDSQGKYAEAETMNRQTLELKEEVLGKTHPETRPSVAKVIVLFALLVILYIF